MDNINNRNNKTNRIPNSDTRNSSNTFQDNRTGSNSYKIRKQISPDNSHKNTLNNKPQENIKKTNYNKYISTPVQTTRTRRNSILVLVLALIIILIVVVVCVQSCKNRRNRGETSETFEMNTVVPVNAETGNSSTGSGNFANYTDSTKTITDIRSQYAILIDLDSNTVIADKNGEAKIFPASMTKIMTLIVAYENIENLDDTFTYTADMLNPLYAQNASQAGFSPDEKVKLRDMLYGAILPSGADATIGLATYVAGSEEKFADLMNEKAADLGLKNTHFVTASGLHNDNHYSTCHDMAVILRYAISNPEMRKILSTYQYTTEATDKHPDGIVLTSTLYNRMEGSEPDDIYVQGGKTGYTNEAMNCLATFAAKCEESMAPYVSPQYILVTASAAGEYSPVYDAIQIYNEYCK